MRSWFDYYGHIIGHNRILRSIFGIRILGPLFRVLLIPLLGLPSLIWYTLRSVVAGIFYEGYLRFLYGFVLLKIGYYAPYLYGRRNTVISRRIKQISRERLAIINMRVEERLTLSLRQERSSRFEEATALYQKFLEDLGLAEDRELKPRGSKKAQSRRDNFFEWGERYLAKVREAYQSQSPVAHDTLVDLEQVCRLFQEIGRIYHAGANRPFLKLRIHEALEMGYIGSVMILHRMFSTPGVRSLLDHVSVEFVLQVKRFAEADLTRYGSEYLNTSYKSLRLVQKARKIFRVIRGTIFPAALVTTLGSPILFQHLKILFREFVYHRAGRLILYTWEANALKRKSPLDLLLW
jgi:hypothetical protein